MSVSFRFVKRSQEEEKCMRILSFNQKRKATMWSSPRQGDLYFCNE
jgi:hypothetical protein